MNRIIRAFAAFIVSICLILAPPMVYANTSIGGWTAIDTITAGATNTINATKTAGGKALKSAVTVAPQVGKVGKYLLKGGGSAALAYAVVELADNAIDWVLDPANNRVKYKSQPEPGNGILYRMVNHPANWYGSREAACKGGLGGWNASVNDGLYNYRFVSIYPDPSGMTCLFYSDYVGNSYQPLESKEGGVIEDEWKYIPIDDVAAKVISNAEAGHADSQEAVKAVALEGFAAGEHDAALDAAATPDTGTENPPDTENPPVAEPFDPSSIISAINSLKAMLAGILSSMTGFFDWAMADPQIEEPDMTPPEIEDITKYDTIDLNQGYVTASGQCPPAADLNINLGVVKLSYEPLCLILEKLSGVIVAVAYISVGFMIIRTV